MAILKPTDPEFPVEELLSEQTVDHRSHAKLGVLLPVNGVDGKTYLLCTCGSIFTITIGEQNAVEVTDAEVKDLVVRLYDATTAKRNIEDMVNKTIAQLSAEFGMPR